MNWCDKMSTYVNPRAPWSWNLSLQGFHVPSSLWARLFGPSPNLNSYVVWKAAGECGQPSQVRRAAEIGSTTKTLNWMAMVAIFNNMDVKNSIKISVITMDQQDLVKWKHKHIFEGLISRLQKHPQSTYFGWVLVRENTAFSGKISHFVRVYGLVRT